MRNFQIINKQILFKDIKRLDVLAPLIAAKVKPGQFVYVLPEQHDTWIVLPVVEADLRRGTIALVFKEDDVDRKYLGSLPIRADIHSILGPLGREALTPKVGTVLCIAQDIYMANLLSICRAFKNAGNKVIGIIEAETHKGLILETQMRLSCRNLHVVTRDGSYVRRGDATTFLRPITDSENFKLVYCIGSVEMMEKVCAFTKARSLATRVQVLPPMECSLGICGSCRMEAGGKTVLACQEGPEFDGHQVDFTLLRQRLDVTSKHKRDAESEKGDAKLEKEKIFAKFFPGNLSR